MKLEPASRLTTRTARIALTYIQAYNTYRTYCPDVHPGLQYVPHVLAAGNSAIENVCIIIYYYIQTYNTYRTYWPDVH